MLTTLDFGHFFFIPPKPCLLNIAQKLDGNGFLFETNLKEKKNGKKS